MVKVFNGECFFSSCFCLLPVFQSSASSCFAISAAEDKFYLSLGSACLVGTLLLIAFPSGIAVGSGVDDDMAPNVTS